MTLLTSPPVTLLLRTTLLLGLALLAVRLLRGPAVQTLAGRGALAAVALLLLTAPLTKFVPPLWHVPAPAAPRPAAPVPVVVLTPVAPPPQFWGAGIGTEKGASPAPTPPPPPNPSFRKDPAKQGGRSPNPPYGGPLLLVLWTTGTGLLLLWLAACQWHLTRLHRRAIPLTGGPAYDTLAALTPNPPRLYACPGIDGPFLAGLLRPAIYLPADHAETFSSDALRAVLAHELAHRDRHDTRWTLTSRLLCALLWPQPLLWLLCRRLEQLSEDACDRAVLARACSPRVYADCLLTLAERRPQSRRTSPLTAGIVPFRSQLARRVQHILTLQGNPPMPAVTRRLRLAFPAAAVLAALGGTLLIAAPVPSSPTPAEPQAPASEAVAPAPLTGATLLAGLTSVQGPGIIVTLNDSEKPLPPMPTGFAAPNLIHDTDIAAVVNELKAAGAEAISINGQRVVATTAIRNAGPTIFINYTSQTPPYVIKAIGNSEALMAGINLPSGITKQIRTYDPAMLSVQKAKALTLPAYAQTVRRQYDTSTALSSLVRTEFLAGLTPVQGPGIIVTLSDSKKPQVPMPAGFAAPNLIHDSDITTVVNELKAAGAEAISINGQRLVATSPIRGVGPTILINDAPQVAPFVIKALGKSKTLQTGIELSGGVTKAIRGYDLAMFTTKVSTEPLLLPAYAQTATPRYAKPAPIGAGNGTSALATAPQARTFTVNFRVPRSGTHRIQVFITDDTGQRSVYDKIGEPATNIMVPITAEGKSVTFRIYNDGKLIQTRDEGIKGRSSAAGNDIGDVSPAQRSALLAQRSLLVSQLNDANAHVDSLSATLKTMRQELKKRITAIKVPLLPVTKTPVKSLYDKSIPPKIWINQQVAAAQNELRRRSSLPPQNPDRLEPQQRLDDLFKKQQFIFAVEEYPRKFVVLYNQEANAEGNIPRSLAKYQNKQRRLQVEIEAIDRQIAAVKAKKS